MSGKLPESGELPPSLFSTQKDNCGPGAELSPEPQFRGERRQDPRNSQRRMREENIMTSVSIPITHTTLEVVEP